jgi:hypothetical protein
LVQETWQLISEKDDEVAEAECCRIFFVDAQEIFPDLALRALNRLEWIRNKLSHEPKLSREADPADPVWEIHQRHHTHKLSRATTELAIAMAHHDPERAIALVRMIPNAAGRYLAVRELAPCIAASDLPRAIELRLQVSGFGDLPRDLAALVATNLAQPLNLPTQVRISQAAKLIGEHLAGTSEATALAFLLEHVAKQTPSLASAMLPQILTGIPWFRMAHSKDTRLAKLADLWGGTVRVADRYGQHSVASERTTLSSDSHEFCVLDAAIAKAHLDDHLETALEDLWMLSAEYYIPKPLAQKMLESIATKVGQLRGNARERLIGELALRAWDICESRAWLIGFLRHLMQMLQVVNRLDERDHIEAEIYVTRALSSALSDDTARWWAFVCEVLKEQAAHGSKHLMAATMAQWAVFESVIDGRVLDELQAAYDQIEAFFGRLPYVLFADLRPKEEDADDR